ncbi:hypothetical protein [Leisingera sp. S232]|uniref:hypothetical protein n=1 Tax=Leisingera sp. S232 TaxID=3415132 RepID=UPI003C7B3486
MFLHGHASEFARESRLSLGPVRPVLQAVPEMPQPAVPGSGKQLAQAHAGGLGEVWFLLFLKGVMDLQFDVFQPGADKQLATEMAQKPAVRMSAKLGVDVLCSVGGVRFGKGRFERAAIPAGQLFNWPHECV